MCSELCPHPEAWDTVFPVRLSPNSVQCGDVGTGRLHQALVFILITASVRSSSHAIQFTPFKVCSSMALVYSELCTHYHNQFQNIFITPKETLFPLVVTPYFSLPSSLGNHYSRSLYGFAYSGHFIHRKSYYCVYCLL